VTKLGALALLVADGSTGSGRYRLEIAR